MHFEITRETLLKPLQSVIGVVERRQTLPVLANVLLEAGDHGLSLTTTDLEVELRAQVDVPVGENGQITLPARKLMDIVRNLPEGATIRFALEQERAVIRAERSRFTLSTLPAGDFPTVEDIGEAQAILLPQSQLRWLIDKTHFAMALQDVRYYLNGLLLEMDPKRLRAVATDGHRLALADMTVEVDLGEARQVIVPRKAVQEVLRLLEHSDDAIRVELGSNHIRAELPEIRFTSKLIDGRFPDYQRVVPDDSGSLLKVDREGLRQALIRASILSNEKFRGVRFMLDAGRLRIQSNNPEQEEAEEEVPVEYGGEPVEIGFNATYMLDALAAVDQPGVDIYVTDGNSSALLVGEGGDDARYVVMPMRL